MEEKIFVRRIAMTAQRVDLYQPMFNSQVGPAPIALRVGVTPNVMFTEGGPQEGITRTETYVLLSALPTDLRERVKLAIQTLITGG